MQNNNIAFRKTVAQQTTLLEFLIAEIPGSNRTKSKQWLSKGQVLVDNTITTQFNAPLQPGQQVFILRHSNVRQFRSPYLRIVYEDRDIIVIDKKEGILTNAPLESKENSVKRILDHYLSSQHVTAHTIHRLDRYTSGLMLFAKTREIQQFFIDNWQQIIADRRYVAVVEGTPNPPAGTIRSYLRDTKTFLTISSPKDNGGKLAITHYTTLKTSELFTLMEFKLQTGRKNQIRVHMQSIHHPIVGDLKYSATTDPIDRVCLHAYQLHFYHPVTSQLMHFTTPIPQVFLSLL